jgi:membrane protein
LFAGLRLAVFQLPSGFQPDSFGSHFSVQRLRRFSQRLIATFQKFGADDGNIMAASVAYYAALAFFPLLLVLTSGLAAFSEFTELGKSAEDQIVEAVEHYASPQAAEDVAEMLRRAREGAAIGGPIGLLILVFAAVTIFAHFDRAFDRIWNVPTPEAGSILKSIRNVLLFRFRAFLLLVGLGLTVLVLFLLSLGLDTVRTFGEGVAPTAGVRLVWPAVLVLVSLLLNTLLFTLIYRFVPKVSVRWPEAFQGGMLAAVAWEVGRIVLTSVLIGDKYSAYEVIGSFLAVMLWIYYVNMILFLGAEYVQVICEECEADQVPDRDDKQNPPSGHQAVDVPA